MICKGSRNVAGDGRSSHANPRIRDMSTLEPKQTKAKSWSIVTNGRLCDTYYYLITIYNRFILLSQWVNIAKVRSLINIKSIEWVRRNKGIL